MPAGGAMNYREDSPYIGRKKGPAIAIQIQLVPKMEINSEFPHSPPPRNKHTFDSSRVTPEGRLVQGVPVYTLIPGEEQCATLNFTIRMVRRLKLQ